MQLRVNPAASTAPAALSKSEIAGALARLMASATFRASPRLMTLLRFIVEHAMADEGPRLKGYIIAVEAFGRASDFDPQTDPIVRVEAGRLRRQLERYYAGEGAAEALIIDLPRGGYIPAFHWRDPAPCAAFGWDRREGGFDAGRWALIELCRIRLQALAAEVVIVEAMIARARNSNRQAATAPPAHDGRRGPLLVVRFKHSHPLSAGSLANVRIKGPLASIGF